MPKGDPILSAREAGLWGAIGAAGPVFVTLAPKISNNFSVSAGNWVVAAIYVGFGVAAASIFPQRHRIEAVVNGAAFPAIFGFATTQIPGL